MIVLIGFGIKKKTKETEMSKLDDYVQDFLDRTGYSLGYDTNTLPEFKDIDIVWMYNITVWDYNGMTEEEYYGGNQ